VGAYSPGGGLSDSEVIALADARIATLVPDMATIEAEGVFTDRIRTALKTSDQTINNQGTLQDVTQLVIPLEANKSYMFESCLFSQGTTTADININFTVPAGASITWSSDALGTGTTTATATVLRGVVTDALQGSGEIASNTMMQPCGRITVGGTGGNLQLQYAQTTPEVSNLIIRTGSWMRVIELV
jgi:hypothetical protein